MNNWVWAVNNKGNITKCFAGEENRGKGRCNHVFHQNKNLESLEEFLEKTSKFKFISTDSLNGVNFNKADLVVGGAQTKWWDEDGKNLYKQDTNDPSRELIQWNALSEEFVSQFLNNIDDRNNIKCAEYETVFINGEIGCISKNFLKENETLHEFSELLSDNDMEFIANIDNENFDEKFEYLCEKIKNKTNYDISNDIIKLIKIDIITMNADRHFGNIGLVFNEKTKMFEFSTIYDNGQCLLSENIYNNIDAYDYKKFDLPGLSIFGMFPMKNYIKFALKHSNKENNISINMDKMENFIENYKNPYYDEDKVEKVKWLLWDNLEIYEELGVINNED